MFIRKVFVALICYGAILFSGSIFAQGYGPAAGTYEIVSKSSGKCLDVFNHLLTDNAPLAQWDCTGEPHQRFHVKPGVRGANFITTLRNDFCVSGANKLNETQVVQHAYCGDEYNDRYNSDVLGFYANGDDSYRVVFARSGMCLDVRGQSLANGMAVQQWHCNGQTNQDWFFRRVAPVDPSAQYELVSVENGKCLDVTNHSLESGTQVQLWTCSGNPNQAFTFTEVRSDVVTIGTVESKMNLSVLDQSFENGAPVIQYRSLNGGVTPGANLRLERSAWKGSYLVKFDHSQRCLETAGHGDGSLVTQNDCSFGNEYQGWILRVKK